MFNLEDRLKCEIYSISRNQFLHLRKGNSRILASVLMMHLECFNWTFILFSGTLVCLKYLSAQIIIAPYSFHRVKLDLRAQIYCKSKVIICVCGPNISLSIDLHESCNEGGIFIFQKQQYLFIHNIIITGSHTLDFKRDNTLDLRLPKISILYWEN